MEVPTATQLRKLRVVDLRKRLQSLELTQSGNKEDLISRLRKYYLDQQEKSAPSPGEMEEREGKEEMAAQESERGEVGEKGGTDVGEEEAAEEDGEEEGGEEGGGGEEDMRTDSPEEKVPHESALPLPMSRPDKYITTGDLTMTSEATEVGHSTGDSILGQEESRSAVDKKPPHYGGGGVLSPEESGKDVNPAMEQLISGPAQSEDLPIPNTDVAPPVITSDYYSDSAREENSQVVLDNPPIAQDSFPIVPTTPPARVPMNIDIDTSNRSRISAQEKTKDVEPKGKKKKKKRRRRRHNQGAESGAGGREEENEPPQPDVEIEYVQEDLLKPGDFHYRQFHKIFELFKLSEGQETPPTATPTHLEETPMTIAAKSAAAQKKQREEESDEEEEPKEPAKLSKKKLRKLNRLTVAQLKQLVDRPDVVEMHDVTAQDPKLLILLKSTRNTVPVPRHWCFKRKYLQGKRGIEKPPFNLPDFIKATGIMEMRQALEEKEDAKSLKQKTRERVRPKMGKLTIDYQKLHDAFFRWQTKPKMSIHGDLYYEGKEFETRLREKKPGDLSDELRRSLGMPTGLGKQKFPPPWLVAMQRYGPPPSYPNLKIPGLNAPIPEGCSFGYFVGGWGKPPVDEVGRPLYGDVFGVDQQDNAPKIHDDDIDKQLWGELESEEEMDEEEESDEEGEMKPEDIQSGLITPVEGGLVTPSGLTSIPAGLETPEMIQLRKKKIEEAMEQGGDTPALYTVLPEKSSAVGGAVMGSSHVYDLSAAVPGATKKAGGGSATEGVEVALDPSELDLDAATMTARYEEQTKLQKEDLSDMVAEHAAKQKKRKRAADSSGGKASKKLKEFKF